MNCNYKVKITDIQTKYKFKVFCTGYDDSEIKEKIDTMYEAWPKASGEGETATLDNTANATMTIDLKGNTSQVTTTGKNLLNLPNGTRTHNGLTGIYENGVLTYSGTATNNYATITTEVDNVLQPGTYTFSIDKAIDCQVRLRFNLADNTQQNVNVSAGGTNTTFTLEQATKTNYVFLNNLTSGNSYIGTIKMQLESGSSATTFEPYTNGASPNPDYPQDVHVVTGDNTITVANKNLISSLTKFGNALYFNGFSSQEIYPFKAGTYTLSYKNANTSFTYMRTVSGTSTSFGSNKSVTFTANEDFNIWLYRSGLTLEEFSEIQLEKGSTATAYEPYQSQSYAVNLGTMELCKIGDYQDRIYKEGDKWYIEKKIGKVVLNGSENTWSLISSGEAPYYRYRYLNDAIAGNCRSNLFILSSISTTGTELGFSISATKEFRAREKTMKTLEDWKTFISSNNLIVYYVLATPTTTEITDTTLISQLEALQGAESYSGQTNISQTNDDKPFILTAKALKDLSNL